MPSLSAPPGHSVNVPTFPDCPVCGSRDVRMVVVIGSSALSASQDRHHFRCPLCNERWMWVVGAATGTSELEPA
jgi:formate dehydrogenase maturation protein FdhE